MKYEKGPLWARSEHSAVALLNGRLPGGVVRGSLSRQWGSLLQ